MSSLIPRGGNITNIKKCKDARIVIVGDADPTPSTRFDTAKFA